jgi:1-acyl-sn-glycerol-3-phosphate acyltransferase
MLYSIGKFIFHIVNVVWFNFKVDGKENIPREGGFIICPNHMNNYDPIVVCTQVRQPIHFMAKTEIFTNRLISWVLKKVNIIPVDRDKVSIDTLKESLGVLKSNKVLGIFPEGTRVKEGERKKPMDGFVVFALKTHSPIVPVHIRGNYKFRGKVYISFGKPIELSQYYGKKIKQDQMDEISGNIMDQIYLTGKDIRQIN